MGKRDTEHTCIYCGIRFEKYWFNKNHALNEHPFCADCLVTEPPDHIPYIQRHHFMMVKIKKEGTKHEV